MDLVAALDNQFGAGLRMLRQCIERCPDKVWVAGKYPRSTWRIAYHCLFYTHLYLMQRESDFQPWKSHSSTAPILWEDDEGGLPSTEVLYTQAELLSYCDDILNGLTNTLSSINYESEESGFSWYGLKKLDHMLLNLRHLATHVGQLQEILYDAGIELEWISRKVPLKP